MTRPTDKEVLAQRIADFLFKKRPESYTAKRIKDIFGEDIHKALFAKAVDLARNTYPIIGNNDGMHYARDIMEWREYNYKKMESAIRIYTKCQARLKMKVDVRPVKIKPFDPSPQKEMML